MSDTYQKMLRRFLQAVCAVVCSAWLISPAQCQSTEVEDRICYEIRGVSPNASGLVSVPFELMNYKVLPRSLDDLRLIDLHFREHAFILRPQLVNEIRWNVTNWQRSMTPDGHCSYTFMISADDPIPETLTIVPAQPDFERDLRVYGVDEHAHESLIGESFIYDFSNLNHTRQLTVPMRKCASRLFRVEVSEPAASRELVLPRPTPSEQAGFDIDQIELTAIPADSTAARASLSPCVLNVEVHKSTSDGQLTSIRLSSVREPISRLQLITRTSDFTRSVQLHARDQCSGGPLVHVGNYTISSFEVEPLREPQLTLDFEPRRSCWYYLTIENGGQPPLDITAVAASGQKLELVFIKNASDTTLFLQSSGPVESETAQDVTALQNALNQNEPILKGNLSFGSKDWRPPAPIPLENQIKEFLIAIAPLFLLVVLCILFVFGVKWLLWTRKPQTPREGQHSKD